MTIIFGWLGAISIGVSLGLLGSGGSILTVPVLVYLFGQDEKAAIAGSLAIVGSIALAGSLRYMRQGLVNWNMVLWFGVPGMLGTYCGAWLATYFAGTTQLALFAGVMLLASYFMFRPNPLATEAPVSPEASRKRIKIIIDGLVVGVVTGLVGVGGGFLIVPALVLLGGLTMHRAVATSLVIIALKSYSGFYKYLDVLNEQNIELDWQAIGLVTALGIAGTLLGSSLAHRVPQKQLKMIFAWFLIAMGIYILARSLPQVIAI